MLRWNYGTLTVINPSSEAPVALFAVTFAVFGIGAGAQFVILIGIGAMKSLCAAVKLSDERLFKYARPKLTHALLVKNCASCMSIRASPKVSALSVRSPGSMWSVMVVPFACPAKAPVRSFTGPQHGAV